MVSIRLVQSSTEGAKKEEHEQTKVVVYRGKKVGQEVRLSNKNIMPHASMLDRYMMSFNYLLETPICHQKISIRLPLAFQEMLNQLDPLFLEEEAEDVSKEIQDLHRRIQEQFMQLVEQKRKVLDSEGVSTTKKLMEKQENLARVKQMAEQEYLKHPLHVYNRVEIDTYLILAFKQNIDEKEQKIIEDYWDLLAAYQKTYEKKTKQLNNYLIRLLLDTISDTLDITQIKKYSTLNEFYQAVIQQLVTKFSPSLEEKMASYQDTFDRTVFDYVILMGQYKLDVILQQTVRQELRSRLQDMENLLEKGIVFFREQNQTNLESYTTERLNKYRSCVVLLDELCAEIQREQAAAHFSPDRLQEFVQEVIHARTEVTLQIEQKEKENVDALRLSLNKVLEKVIAEDVPDKSFKCSLIQSLKDIDDCHNKIKECQSKTDKDFKKLALEKMKERFGETPDEICTYFPEQTMFENLIFELRKIENPSFSTNLELLSHAMYFILDISWDTSNIPGNPLRYFLRQLEEIDQEKLALLKPQVEVIE